MPSGGGFTIKVDIYEWLSLTAKGRALNYSNSVAANTTLRDSINPPSGYDYIMFHAIQWDGITPGTVTFELHGGQNSLIAGYAVQTFIQDELYLTDRGRPLQVTVVNASTAPIVMNIDYIGIQANTWEREVLPAISSVLIGGF